MSALRTFSLDFGLMAVTDEAFMPGKFGVKTSIHTI
jgi:hypothetical protein